MGIRCFFLSDTICLQWFLIDHWNFCTINEKCFLWYYEVFFSSCRWFFKKSIRIWFRESYNRKTIVRKSMLCSPFLYLIPVCFRKLFDLPLFQRWLTLSSFFYIKSCEWYKTPIIREHSRRKVVGKERVTLKELSVSLCLRYFRLTLCKSHQGNWRYS